MAWITKCFARCGTFGLLLLLNACAGVSVGFLPGTPIDAETITIRNFNNEALDGPPNLQNTFSETLREYYNRNTKLEQVPSSNELLLEGSITEYIVTPVAPGATANQTAELQRLNITITATFTNFTNEQLSFEGRKFSSFEDFPASQNLADVENDLITEIFDQIAFDIFNASVANW